jgi:hypothetical protein
LDALYNLFDFLIHPTFWDPNNPPLKVNVNAKTIGLVAAILGAIGLLLYLFLIPATLAIGTAMTVLGTAIPGTVHPGILIVALVGLVIALISEILWTWGGWKMYNEDAEGRKMVVASLGISIVGSIVYNIGSGSATGWLGSLIISAIIYYFVMIARFPNEAPLTASTPPPPAAGPPTV